MKKKQTIALIAITASTINSFMLRHIEVLSKDYNLLIFCNDTSLIRKKIPKNVLLTNINFKRQLNLIFDFVSFLSVFYDPNRR